MTRQDHIEHLEKRLAEAQALGDTNMVEMIVLKLNRLKGGKS